ncbi:MAG: prepilin-type N-terminal cleavage/methylation domain-containing protein [Armatimonadetes bacterium]|nr:prepilin-type N-terminal cleavage/methylation domain-containing protein [Armatimonadota bacterium]MBS1702280.1 prepilin-type N-terminal cleavage/methylation domain-containing protein [Armatimonadota bacterium]MBS1727114.1 prepilin-type N-terminal cleavage/methylation domain-containing protein [Armatimonadota bacterium]
MKQRAFTLIELLVVIAIIAILAAILFPVFAQAKLAAKKASTLSNMKQSDLGLIMYCGDSDDVFPMAEYGDGDINYPHITWTTSVFPYVKNGDNATNSQNQKVCTGKDGIFKDIAGPAVNVSDPNTDGYYFGVNRLICADDYDGGQPWFNGNGQVINSMSQTEMDAPADKILIAAKGLNNPSDKWNYPWFVDWQFQYIDSIATTPGNASTVYRDGDTSWQPSSPVYSPVYNTDCNSSTSGAWECAAHPRYRYGNVGVFGFSDGHAKAIPQGGLKWFKNIYVQRGGITSASWTYGWYYPQEPF